MNKIIKLLVLSLASLTLASCGDNGGGGGGSEPKTEWNDKSSITVSELSKTIKVDSTYQINAKGSGTLTYKSTDETVASVNSTGLVTGVSEGDAGIKISNETDFVYVKIHVGEASGKKIEGTLSVYLPIKDLNLYIGENYTVSAKAMVNGKEVEGATFTFESSNPSVASVADGKVSALASGSAIIKVTANSEGTKATGQVVVNVNENLIYLVPDFETREVVTGSPINLNVCLIQNAEVVTEGVGSPTYSVDNKDVAFVQNNQLFAIRKGKVQLTATVAYAGDEFSFKVDITTRELYKITYWYNSQLLYEEYVKSGDCITYKDVPVKVDSVFKAWTNGEKLVYADTPIDYAMNLQPKWLVYSDDILGGEKSLLWDYSTGNELVCNNNAGAYLWEDFQYPDCRINVQMTSKSLLITDIYLPKFEYALYPAVSFYFYNQLYNTQFVYGSFESSIIENKARNQVSIVGDKLYYNGQDTGEVVDLGVLTALDSFKLQIKAPTNSGGKLCLSGFYGHLSEE